MTCDHIQFDMSRREFFGKFALGIGGMALARLAQAGLPELPSFPGRAKRIIYLFMSGGPSQMDLFDYKPLLNKMNGQELPASVRMGQRLTTMSAFQASLPLAGSIFKFQQHGRSGAWVSELLPHTAKVVDELCFVKSMHTEAINHDPAITFFQTGAQQAGRPSMGSWISYGLGSLNDNLPAFVVLISKNATSDQPLYARLWGNGFLPSMHQGVQFRAGKDPVLYLTNPPGVTGEARRKMLDRLAELHQVQYQDLGDPDINARVSQYEMAYRMQTSVPEVMNISKEPESVLDLYGSDSRKPGTFAANCLLARRLAERNVRFIQLYHQGWDHHGGLPNGIRNETRKTDQACAALILDLKERGLLDDTIVIWGGEFGRTSYSQGKLTATDYGRDHHPRCFTMWMAGGGFKPGFSYGETDDFSYNVARDPVHVHDLQATILHQLGVDHEQLTFKFQGRRYRLTDVHGKVVKQLLALALALFVTSCASYKVPSSSFTWDRSGEHAARYAAVEQQAQEHPLYRAIPRHRSQVRWYDMPRWVHWGLAGNDDNGIFGESQPVPYSTNIHAGTFVRWSMRNPLHNFSFYVVGSAHWRRHYHAVLFSIADGRVRAFARGEKKVFDSDNSFKIAFNDFKPFIALQFSHFRNRLFQFYVGWRDRGNLGFKLRPWAKRTSAEKQPEDKEGGATAP